MKISELAIATQASVEGEQIAELTGAAGLDIAGPGQVTFLANPRYTGQVRSTRASAIFVAPGVDVQRTDIIVLRAKDPYLAYTRALRIFHAPLPVLPFIHPAAVIDASASVAADVSIGACVVIGRDAHIASGAQIFPNVTIYDGVNIGADSVIHSGAVLRAGTQVGQRVVIQSNVVVGSDGFGYAKDEDGHWLKIPQTGRVVIEDDVEIGAGTTIDCASVGETRIARGAKIDNLVQIGHSCTVGEDSLLCAQVGLAGSSVIGKRVLLAGQVGIAGHLSVGDDAVLTAKSAISHNVPAGKMMSGIPAFDNRDWLRATAAFRRLGELQKRLRAVEARLGQLGAPDDSSSAE